MPVHKTMPVHKNQRGIIIIIINLVFRNRRTGFMVCAQNIFVVVTDSFGVPAK
jgi:hypothetical protein